MPGLMLSDALGVYLSDDHLSNTPGWGPLPVVPQYQEIVPVRSSGWTQIGFSYAASGGEYYLTIGNFKNHADIQFVGLSPGAFSELYYFVDDVEVVDCGTSLRANGAGSICLGESALLWAHGGQNYTWVTATDPHTVIGYGDSIRVSPPVTTTYYVYSDNARDSVTVQVIEPVPTVQLGNDTTVCGGVFLLTLQNPQSGTRYTWSNGHSVGPVGVTFQSGTVVVMAEQNGCMATDTIEVTMKPAPYVSLGPDRGLCPGQSITLSAAYGASTYRWQDGSVDPVYTVTSAGTYSVILNLDGCERGDTVQVTDVPAPVFDLGNDTTVCANENLLLEASVPGAVFRWQDQSGGMTHRPRQSGTYWVEATLGICTASDTIRVRIDPAPGIDLGADFGLCPGQTRLLDVGTPGATYRWWDDSVAPTHVADSGGTYSVTVTLGSCTDADTVIVTNLPDPEPDLGADTAVCSGSIFVLDASFPGATYRWQDNSVGATFRPVGSGTYWVQVTLNGCSVSDSIQVTVNPTPEVDLGPDRGLCPGQTRTLDVGIPGAVYVWQDHFTGSVYTVTAPGRYSVTVSLGECSAGDSITITASPDPDFELGPDIRACEGNPVVLDASVPGGTYVWQDFSTGSTFQPLQSGIYRVAVTLGECTLADSVTVLFHPLPTVNLGADSMACQGATVLLDASAPGLSYRWQDGSTQSTYSVTRPGNYTVEITDGNGCKNTDAVRIGFDVPLSFEFPDSVLCYGNVWVLDIGNENAYCVWQDKTVGPRYTVANEGTYIAVAGNACGSHADTVTVGYRRCDCGFYLPNAFTPEQDGINERFAAVQNVECDLDEYEFTVFDRWGGVLFATRNIQFGWDGRADGQAVPVGVYPYRIVYRFHSMPVKTEWGKIVLLR